MFATESVNIGHNGYQKTNNKLASKGKINKIDRSSDSWMCLFALNFKLSVSVHHCNA